MSLVTTIEADLITAMKAGDADKLSVLRMTKSALKNKSIELGHELSDDEAIAVIGREMKQRRDAEAEFRAGNRPELADKEAAEAAMLAEYLPAQLSEAELVPLVEAAIAKTGASTASDMGKVMGALMPETRGKADGSLVSKLVKERLGA
ncbi:MAG: GatB/YqeY domain-containing protein [Patescibacteria group bacterium]